jgi:hypothetical protein
MAEIAWAGGLFEGEGSIWFDGHRHRTGTGRLRLGMSLSLTDHDVITRFCRIVGHGTVAGPYMSAKSTKPYWIWQVRNAAAVGYVSELLRPWLGERRTRTLDELYAKKAAEDALFVEKPRGRQVWYRKAKPIADGQTRLP